MAESRSESIVKCCNDLLAFEHVAIGGYRSAIEGLRKDRVAIAEKLTDFLGDHERHVRELEAHVRHYGGEPRTTPGVEVVFKKPLMEIKKMLGAESILSGMVTNEEAARDEYRGALERVQKESFPADVIDTCRRALADEERHLAYCKEQHLRLKDEARSMAEGYGGTARPRPPRESEPRTGAGGI
jgi:uncharacterized protein (TIGR02284 family)